MDYKAFLEPKPPIVLPYFGGTRVDAADRRFTVVGELQPGWWTFEIDGRRVTAVARAEPVDLAALPVLRGHWVDGWIVANGRELGRIALPPEDEPAPLARATARRWYSGDYLLESIDFEDEAELEARRALEDRRPLHNLRGVVPSLRAAFGYAFTLALGRELGMPITLPEIAPSLVAIADAGRAAAQPLFDEMLARRREAELAVQRRLAAADAARRMEVQLAAEIAREEALTAAARSAQVRRRSNDPTDRADAALDAAGARMLSCRRTGHGARLEVTFQIDSVRILSTVDASSLQVLDAGICLDGSNRELTLDSLPSVVREAISSHRLNITRR